MGGRKKKKDDDDPPPVNPVNVPKGKPGKNCPTCGQPRGSHTLEQLMDCLASQQ